MNRQELVKNVLCNKTLLHLTQKDVDGVVSAVLDTIKTTVKKGTDVTLIGFGTFTKSKRAARTGVNPSTGEKIQILANTVPRFRPGKAFKDLISTRKRK